MAVTQIGLSKSQSWGSQSNGLQVRPGETLQDVYLHWHTIADFGTGWNAKFGIALNWRGVPRGVTGGDGGYGKWQYGGNGSDGLYYVEVPEGECLHRASPSGGTDWCHSFDLAGILDAVFPDGLSFSARDYDEVQFSLTINAIYSEACAAIEGYPNSPSSFADLYIGFVPTFVLESASVTLENLVIDYGADGWERRDDSYSARLTQGGKPLGSAAGRVSGVGRIVIPLSSLARTPKPSQTLSVDIEMNPSYRGISGGWASIAGSVSVDDATKCNTPTIAASVSEGALVVTVTDSGDRGVPITGLSVALEGGGLSCDRASASLGKAVYMYPPFDIQLTVSCTATGDESMCQTEQTVQEIPSNLMFALTRIDDGSSGSLAYNVERSKSVTREMSEVKLRGHERSSVAFGDGSTVSRSLKGTLSAEDHDDADFFDSLADAGLVIVRYPGGDRFVAAIGSVSISPTKSKTDVSLTMTEVEDGRIR